MLLYSPPPPWSLEEMDRLLALWDAGKTATEIELAMGGVRSRNAILGKVYRLRKGGVRFGERGSPLFGRYHGPYVSDRVVPGSDGLEGDSGHPEGTSIDRGGG